VLGKGVGRKISGEATKKTPKNSKKTPKNNTFKPLYYICIMYENLGGGTAPLPTPMVLGEAVRLRQLY